MRAKQGPEMPEGVEIRGDRLRITFHYEGARRRETLKIPPTPANIKYAARLRAEVLNQIERRTFDYAATFPNSKVAKASKAIEAAADVTVGEALDAYLEQARSLASLSPSTTLGYSKWSEARLKPRWGNVKLKDLKTADLRGWIVGTLSASLSPKSVRNCVGFLHAVLARAVDDGLIQSNPLSPIDLRTVLSRKKTPSRRKSPKPDPFNDSEVLALLEATPTKEERALYTFALASGLRPGELIALRWEHVNFTAGSVTVKDNIVTGEHGAILKDTKTSNTRVIPLLPSARAALLTIAPEPRVGFVFLCPRTGQRWADDNHIRRYWTRNLKAAGVRYRNPYQTRHTFASKLLEQGESTTLVAELLGHTTTEMVIRTYGTYIHQEVVPKLRADVLGFTAPQLPQTESGTSES